jgi:uroporphyrinogen decarboxylase
MESLERTWLTLRHKIPDRVPIDLHNFMVTARMMGTQNYGDFFRSGEAMAEGQILAWKTFGHDVILIENGTAALAEACGVEAIYPSNSAPVAKKPAIASLDEVDRLQVPDPYKDPLLSEVLKATRIVAREIGDRAFVMGRADAGPFSLACEIRGMSEFMMDLIQPEKADKIFQLLEFCLQASRRYAVAQMEQGAHATSIGDSTSGPDLISPRTYRRFAWPYARRLVEDLKAQGIPLAYHICGNATPIIDDMVASGAAILEIDQKADMAACKAASLGRTTLLGTVDPSEVMALGTPELVREKAQAALDVLAPGGGFILGPGCALPPTTPEENIHALVETGKRHRYGGT